MDTHLEAAQALQRRLQQATLKSSDTPSILQWQALFDAHIINLENHAMILEKVMTLPGIADVVRTELKGMREVGVQSRQAAVGMKGLLFQQQAANGQAHLTAQSTIAANNISNSPFPTRIKVSGLGSAIQDSLLAAFKEYEVIDATVVSQGSHSQPNWQAVITVPTGRMATIAISEMNGRMIKGLAKKHPIKVQLYEEHEKAGTVHGVFAPDTSQQRDIRQSHDIDIQATNISSNEGARFNLRQRNQTEASLPGSSNKKRKAGEIDLELQMGESVKRIAHPKRTDTVDPPSPPPPSPPPPPETLDITDEVERRLREKEEAREHAKHRQMHPAGRKRLRESFESAEHLQLSEPSPQAKRHKDTPSPRPEPSASADEREPSSENVADNTQLAQRGRGFRSSPVREDNDNGRLKLQRWNSLEMTARSRPTTPSTSDIQPQPIDGRWVFSRDTSVAL